MSSYDREFTGEEAIPGGLDVHIERLDRKVLKTGIYHGQDIEGNPLVGYAIVMDKAGTLPEALRLLDELNVEVPEGIEPFVVGVGAPIYKEMEDNLEVDFVAAQDIEG